MKYNETEKKEKKKTEVSIAEIKKEPTDQDAAKKGYDEKNPLQPQGAFYARFS